MSMDFPFLHVDTTFKFSEMYEFRTEFGKRPEVDLLIHINQEGVAQNINPFDQPEVELIKKESNKILI